MKLTEKNTGLKCMGHKRRAQLRHETRDHQCKWHEHKGNTENTYRMEKTKTKTKTQKTLKILKINKCKTINGVTKR